MSITLPRYKAFSTPRWGLRDQNFHIPKICLVVRPLELTQYLVQLGPKKISIA